MQDYNLDKPNYNKSIKKIFLLIPLLLLICYGIYYSQIELIISDTFTDDTISIKAPIAFEKAPDGYYWNNASDMCLNWYYANKDFGFTLDEMMPIVFTQWFPNCEEYGEQIETMVGGCKAIELRYKCVDIGDNYVHYYFSGIMTVVELDNRFLIIDIYYSLDEEKGINSDISDSKLKTIKNMLKSVEINDNTMDYPNAELKKFNLDSFEITLTDEWENNTEDVENPGVKVEYTESEVGKFAYIEAMSNAVKIQCEVENNNYENSIDGLKESLEDPRYSEYYNYIDDDTLLGEPCILFSYKGLKANGYDCYVCGVFVISEHYYGDMYVLVPNEEFEISKATQKVFVNTLLNKNY